MNGYTFTGSVLAWATTSALEHGMEAVGALGPATAFGLDRLEAGCAEAGIARVRPRADGILSAPEPFDEAGAMAVATATYQEKTDEQKAITEMVRQFVDNEIIPVAEEFDHEDKFPEAIVEQMKELGLFGVTIPEEYGGHGPRPDHLRDDRRGALARLDLDLRRRQHPLHRLLPADEVRHRRAEGALPAEDGDRRDPRRLLALRARGRLRRAGHQVDREAGRRRQLGAQRPEDVGHQRARLRRRVRAHEDRPEGRPALQGDDLLHHREGALGGEEHRRLRRARDPAEDQEDGLQGRRVDRARLRRLPLPARAHPRRPGRASARASCR